MELAVRFRLLLTAPGWSCSCPSLELRRACDPCLCRWLSTDLRGCICSQRMPAALQLLFHFDSRFAGTLVIFQTSWFADVCKRHVNFSALMLAACLPKRWNLCPDCCSLWPPDAGANKRVSMRLFSLGLMQSGQEPAGSWPIAEIQGLQQAARGLRARRMHSNISSGSSATSIGLAPPSGQGCDGFISPWPFKFVTYHTMKTYTMGWIEDSPKSLTFGRKV